MGATYARQSSYTDGDTITAAHTNNEFDQLLAAFASSTGHTHDGTTAEGGPITKLLGTSITVGDGSSATDITVTFDGESNDGVLKWMEDEDYFEFSDDLLIASTEKIQFRDTGLYIYSSVDGQLDLVADTEIQIAATTIDINGAADISGNLGVGGNLTVTGNATVTGTTTFNGGTLTFGDAASDNVVFGADVNSSIIPNTDDTYDLGSSGQQWKDIYIDGVAYLDSIDLNGTAISSTAAEINLIDGGTARGTTAVASGDGILINDAGTMRMTNVDTVSTYFSSHSVGGSSIVTTGALNSGSITSGFGTIDTGSSTITTTGLISGGSLDIDNVLINGTTIGHTDDTDLITVADGLVTVAGEVSMTTLDIGGTNVTSTAAELNILDGKAFLDEDNLATDSATGIASQQSIKAYVDAATGSSIVATGALNSGSITSGFGNIDTGSSTITTTGLISGGSLDIDNVLINGTTIGHTDDTDLITLADGVVTVAGEISVTTLDIGGTNISSTAAELNALDGITAVVGELNALDLGATAVGTAIASKAVILDSNKDYTGIRNFTISGELDAATLDISGAVDIAGTTNLDVVDIDGAVQLDATLTIGANDQGYDVILYGDTASANMTWDTSADDLIFNGAARIVVPDGQLVLGSTAVSSTAAELNQLDGVVAKTAGKETIWVPSSAMQPTTSNGCSALTTVETTSGRPDLVVLDFDKDSDEFAQFSVAFPKSWNAGTVTFQVFWAGIAATSDVDWMVDAVAISNNTTIDVAYGTAVVVTDNAQGAVEELNVSAESGALTIAGSPGDDELCFFRIGRDVSGDGMAGDARLVGIKLFFTTDLANDA